MRIDATNLIAAQAARPPAQAASPVASAPKAAFEQMDFPKATKAVSTQTPATANPPRLPGSQLDITV